MQGPDGQPGYQHVLKLAKALLEDRSLQGLSDKRVDELMALWQRLPEPDRRRVVYPPRHRERQPKGRFKTAKGKNTSCPGKESLQRFSRHYRWDKDSPSITTSRRCRDLQGGSACLIWPHPPSSPSSDTGPGCPSHGCLCCSASSPSCAQDNGLQEEEGTEADAARGGPPPGSRRVSTPAASPGQEDQHWPHSHCRCVLLFGCRWENWREEMKRLKRDPEGVGGGMIALFSLIVFYLYIFESILK
ncbi:hypothetical protein OYC64_009105 [Pagothenia borchgrevinki]|uniref:Uncharacterized protein n=1 Tax=Pagothenia borchgrevinki TaxID=8213 RepID=A0ABD2G6N8_PAGBO